MGIPVDEVVSESQIAADAKTKTMPFFFNQLFLTMRRFYHLQQLQGHHRDRLPVIAVHLRSIGATKAVAHILFNGKRPFMAWRGGLMGILCYALALKESWRMEHPYLRESKSCCDFLSPSIPFPLLLRRCSHLLSVCFVCAAPAADHGVMGPRREAYSQAMDCRSRMFLQRQLFPG